MIATLDTSLHHKILFLKNKNKHSARDVVSKKLFYIVVVTNSWIEFSTSWCDIVSTPSACIINTIGYVWWT